MEIIAFFEIEDWEKTYIEKSLTNTSLLFTSEKAQEAVSQDFFQASIISSFIYSKLTGELLRKFPNLKLIATRSTGFDHIDLSYCKERGIRVVNVPTYGTHTVAEHTFALILAISRKIIPAVERSKRGNFSLNGLRGFDLSGKTLGVIGAGNIGSKVIKLGRAFGMQVLVYTRHPEKSPANENLRYVSFEELISSSDIISLHVPYSKETHHIINRENIKKFKKGSILINSARGPLVETQAILEGLENGILQAAGLDVLEEECSLKEERQLLTEDFLKTCDLKTQLLNHVLLTRDDVLLTCHNAFNSNEALASILSTTIANITAFLQGKPTNLVEY